MGEEIEAEMGERKEKDQKNEKTFFDREDVTKYPQALCKR
jgi:hypothetical protein